MFHKLQKKIKSTLFGAFFPLFVWGDAHILVYHRFDDPRYPSTNTSLEKLQKDFEYIQKHHYQVVALQKLALALKNHKKIPDNWIIITIDDGFKSFLRALPLFKKFSYPFTIFIATKPIEKNYPDFLSWKDIEKIEPLGTIAFHSHSHLHLCDLNDKEIKADLQKGVSLLRKHHIKPLFFAYPYGEYDNRVKKIVQTFGFRAICNQNLGAVSEKSDIYDLDRIAMVGKNRIQSALRWRYLKAYWIEPKAYPKNSILSHIKVKTNPKYKKGWLYITGFGWQKVRLHKGVAEIFGHYLLRKKRIRLILKVKDSKINTKLFVRSRYGTK